MNAVSPPPAGWYPDPSGRAPFRYWDGARWTEHTDQGTAPSPSLTAPAAPAAPAAAPMYTPPTPGHQPPAPGYAPAAPGAPMAAAAPAGGNWTTAQSFIEDVKKADGLALVVVGFVIFVLASFLSWTSGESSYIDPFTGQPVKESGSANAWEDDNAWLIRGVDVDDLLNRQTNQPLDSGNDMVIMLPIALAAAGVAVASRVGKKIKNHAEIVLGASGVLAVLVIAEAVAISGAIDDVSSAAAAAGQTVDAGLAYGFYIGIAAALVMAGGAAKHYLANKQAKA